MPKFRLPDFPSPDCNSAIEIADWWEIEAICSATKKFSLGSLRRGASRPAENDPDTDMEDDIVEESRFDFAVDEIRLRQYSIPNGHYPFSFGASDRIIEFDETNANGWLYLYLLLATRLNMTERRLQGDIDGALLFEEVCEVALATYGGPRHKAHRFGTSASQGGFEAKLRAFFADLKEFNLRDDRAIPNHAGDNGLDIALWGNFSWSGGGAPRRGKLIILAQCKTGTSWGDADLARLDPSAFFCSWMSPQPLGDTARAFMVTSCIDASKWEDYHRLGGLIFDRLRIVDCVTGSMPAQLSKRVQKWTQHALQCEDLPG